MSDAGQPSSALPSYPPPAGPVVSWEEPPPARPPGLAAVRTEMATDLRAALQLTAVLILTGAPAGLLWWLLAPRAQYRITTPGSGELVNSVTDEFLAADDGVYVLVLAGLGLLAGLAGWLLLRRRRGITVLLALAVGTTLAATLAWQLGELLGAKPSEADAQRVGNVVTSGLELASTPAALAVAPFAAVLVYVAGTLFSSREDLGRR